MTKVLSLALALVACVEKPVPSSPDAPQAAAAGLQSVPIQVPPDGAPLPPPRPEAPPPEVPSPPPGKRRDATAVAGDAYRAAAGDLDGDRREELALADDQRVWIVDRAGRTVAETSADAGVQILTILDADGDGRRELAVGWGETGKHKGGKAKVSLYHLQKGKLVEEVVFAPRTERNERNERNEIVAILASRGGLFLAWFESKYMVKSARATRGAGKAWTLAETAPVRMATSHALGDVDGDQALDVLVGRVYGDTKDRDGDAFFQRPDGSRLVIPTLRGVRALVAADSDGDGRDEVFLSDGWHQNYGKFARALLSWSRLEGDAFQTTRIEESPGQFSMSKLLAADLDGDHRPEIIAQGSNVVRVFKRRGEGWSGITVFGLTRDIAVVDGILLAIGDKGSEWIDLREAL